MAEHPLDQLEAYGLGLLSPEAGDAITAHLAGCATCQARLRDIERTLGLLARLAPEETPPAEAEERLMARVAELRRAEGRETPGAGSEPPAAPSIALLPPRSAAPVRVTPRVGQSTGRRRSGVGAPTALARRRLQFNRVSAAFATLAAALLLVATLLGADLRAAQQQEGRLSAQAQTQQRALAIMNAPGAVVQRLSATDPGYQDAAVTMAMDPQSGQGALVISHLAPTASDKVYELWLVDATGAGSNVTVTPTQAFTVRGDGSAVVLFTSQQPVSALRNAGVSVERRDAPPSPHSPMVLLLHAS